MKSFLFFGISQPTPQTRINPLGTAMAMTIPMIDFHLTLHQLPSPDDSSRLLLCCPFICPITSAGWSTQIAPHCKLV